MTISLEAVAMMFFGTLISVIAYFIKRDIARFERSIEEQNKAIIEQGRALAAFQTQLATVLKVTEWIGHLDRFFGEGGGQQRIWKVIDKIQHDQSQLRDRDHWIANKLTIIKGRMELGGTKFLEGEWSMPEWKSGDSDVKERGGR